jgi:hypothetical protein
MRPRRGARPSRCDSSCRRTARRLRSRVTRAQPPQAAAPREGGAPPRKQHKVRRGCGFQSLGSFELLLPTARPCPTRASRSLAGRLLLQVQWADASRPALQLEMTAGSQTGALFAVPPHLSEVRRLLTRLTPLASHATARATCACAARLPYDGRTRALRGVARGPTLRRLLLTLF